MILHIHKGIVRPMAVYGGFSIDPGTCGQGSRPRKAESFSQQYHPLDCANDDGIPSSLGRQELMSIPACVSVPVTRTHDSSKHGPGLNL